MNTNYTRILASLLLMTASAFAWNCPSGQIRQQAPAGTPTTAPYYDVVEGIAFICAPSTPPTTPTTASNNNTNSNSNSNSNSNKNSNNNANTNTLSNNISTKVTNTLAQQQQQSQQQSQTATGGNAQSSAANNGNGNGDGSNNTTTNVAAPKIPVTTAVAPAVLPTVPCFKGVGVAAQTMAFGGSFGGGKVDQGCDDRELARSFAGPQTIASCKILLSTKKAKKAGITLEDCLGPQLPPVVVTVEAPRRTEPVIVPQAIIVPVTVQPVVTVIAPPEYNTSIDVIAPKRVVKKRVVRHTPPECQNVITRKCVTHSTVVAQ